MSAENRILRILMTIAAILTMAMLFIIISDRGKGGPGPAGGRNAVERILDAFRQRMNVRSPAVSDGELREKARQYLK
jgi:hypothetical protein